MTKIIYENKKNTFCKLKTTIYKSFEKLKKIYGKLKVA